MNTRNITLIKYHPNVQLGHLYEHIIARTLNDALFSKGLIKSVDYALQGSTYETGIIIIDIDIYNSSSLRIIKKFLSSIVPSFDDSTITTALFQIAAEERHKVEIQSLKTVISSLTTLNTQPWQQLDDLNTVDTRNLKVHNKLINLSSKKVKVRTISFSIELPKKDAAHRQDITPLFLLFAKALLLVTGDRLAKTYGFYSGDFFVSQNGTKVTAKYYAAQSPYVHSYSQKSIQSTAQESIDAAIAGGFTDRLMYDLQRVSFSRHILEAPHTAWIAEHTGIVVGRKGWRKLATSKNFKWLANKIFFMIQLEKFD